MTPLEEIRLHAAATLARLIDAAVAGREETPLTHSLLVVDAIARYAAQATTATITEFLRNRPGEN